jgi:hypothetical protein
MDLKFKAIVVLLSMEFRLSKYRYTFILVLTKVENLLQLPKF